MSILMFGILLLLLSSSQSQAYKYYMKVVVLYTRCAKHSVIMWKRRHVPRNGFHSNKMPFVQRITLPTLIRLKHCVLCVRDCVKKSVVFVGVRSSGAAKRHMNCSSLCDRHPFMSERSLWFAEVIGEHTDRSTIWNVQGDTIVVCVV